MKTVKHNGNMYMQHTRKYTCTVHTHTRTRTHRHTHEHALIPMHVGLCNYVFIHIICVLFFCKSHPHISHVSRLNQIARDKVKSDIAS